MKKLIIFLFVLVLLSSFVSAYTLNDDDVYFDFDDTSNPAKDSTETYDFTHSDPTGKFQQTKIPTYSTSSISLDGTTDWLNSSPEFIFHFNHVINTSWETSIWISNDGVVDADSVYYFAGAGQGFTILISGGANFYSNSFYTAGGTKSLTSASPAFDPDVEAPHMLTIGWNETHYYMYINDSTTLTWSVASSDKLNDITSVSQARLGANVLGNDAFETFTGNLDEFILFNYSLTYAQRSDLFDNGIIISALGIPANPIWVTPSADSNNNINITINVSSEAGVNYYLYVNNISYLSNVSQTGNYYKTWQTNFSDGNYVMEVSVQNTTSGSFSNNVSRTLLIDTISPIINLLSGNGFLSDNSTIISSYISNLTINISFYDKNLYRTRINITNSTGQSVYNYSNSSITQTTDNHSKLLDIGSWAIGNYTVALTATDSHTTLSINDYDVKEGIDYFRYTTKEGNVIKIKSNNLNLFTKSTTLLTDRYEFEFNYLFQQDTYTFTIESYNKIDYMKDSDYNAHFVIMGSNGGNWLDFENSNLNSKDYTITKIDDYTYEVEILANGLKSFTFSSLGGLNTAEEHYLLRIASVIDVWVYDGDSGAELNATVVIGVQSNSTVVNTTPATLQNITKEITEVILNASGYGIETKTIAITSNYHNFSLNMTETSAVKIYFYDESSEELIEGETFSVYLETTGFAQTYSSITDNPYSIKGLDSGLYKLKASSTNYPEREYKDLNISNTTTTNLNVYLINSTLGSEITFNIVGEALNPLEDVRTVFTKIIGGAKTVVAEEDSDFAGQVVLTLDDDTEYTINFTKSGYETKTIDLEPKDSEYVITMISTVGAYNVSVHEGIRYRFSPINTVLNNNTKYNFTFTLNSTIWEITNCNLTLKNGSEVLNTTSSYVSTGCYMRIEQNTFGMTNITSEAIYELANQYAFTVSQQYSIIYTYQGDFSLMSFLDDLTDFSMAGFDSFGRMMLAFICIFIIMAMASMKVGFENKEILLFVLWGLVGLFSFIGWFTLNLGTMPNLLGIKKYFIFYIVSLIVIAFIVDKVRK